MKQAKADEKKNAKDAKKKGKEDPPADGAEKQEKRTRGRKRQAAEPPDAGAAVPKAKGRRKTQPNDETKEEQVEETKEDHKNFEIGEIEPKPSGRPKRAPRAKRADHAEEEKKPEPKVAPKRKAKAKSAAKKPGKAKSAPKGKQKAAEESSDENVQTPRKELFQSDEETSEESAHERLEKKSGAVKPLTKIFEDDAPEQWRRSRGTNDGQSAASQADRPPPDAKPAKSGRRKKAALSPMAKKLAKKRKQKTDEVMHEQLKEDAQLQGIFCQHLKVVGSLTYDTLKEYLLKHGPKDCGKFVLDPYWGRTACGVKSKEMGEGNKKSMPLVAYFPSFGTASTWNDNMTLTYVSAWLMAAWLMISRCAFQFPTSWGLRISEISLTQLQVCWYD